jgi:hypothetical protein
MPLQGNPAAWRAGSRISEIYRALASNDLGVHTSGRCSTCDPTYRELRSRLGSKPFIYRSGGVEMPPGVDRGRRLRNEVFEVHEHMVGKSWLRDADGDVGCGGCDNGECCGSCPCCPSEAPEAPAEAPEPAPAPAPVSDLALHAERFYGEVQKRRAFARVRKLECLDSMRIIIDGVKALRQGVPVEALLASIDAALSSESRAQLVNYRPEREHLQPEAPEGYDYATFAPRPSEFAHATSAYVDALIAAGTLVWLHGPAGTGKSSAAKYAARRHAERRGLTGEKTEGRTYFEVNCSGAMVSAVKGRDTIHGKAIADFMLAYEHGGTICLEEFDGAHPSLGTFIGTALAATDGFVNDIMGRWVERHQDFRCIVTANSLGYGDAKFKRNDLDAATKDRFRVGRVYTGLDMALERTIFNSLLEV